MLAFASAVNETCRADLGRWVTREVPNVLPGVGIVIERPADTVNAARGIAAVLFTSDLRLSAEPGKWEDETGRANANLLADAPRLLMVLAELLDAVQLRGTASPYGPANLERAANVAAALLARHADTAHAADWWAAAQIKPADELERNTLFTLGGEG